MNPATQFRSPTLRQPGSRYDERAESLEPTYGEAETSQTLVRLRVHLKGPVRYASAVEATEAENRQAEGDEVMAVGVGKAELSS